MPAQCAGIGSDTGRADAICAIFPADGLCSALRYTSLSNTERLERGANAGKDFPRSFGNEGPETPPCFYCGTETTRKPGPNQFNREHNIPKVQGGNNSPENYLPSCRDCNLNKGGRSADEWYSIREGA
ncbi:HNH endonuclease [Bradyrhizobium betae]|uniref:HNH endonuclease n=1 Tax=Bradyrhizobium betae TaxID=244734 RepID=UPI003D67933C